MSDPRRDPTQPRSGRLSSPDPIGLPYLPPSGRRIRVFTSDNALFAVTGVERAVPADPLMQEAPLRHIHSARAMTTPEPAAAVCSSCVEELSATEPAYRLVLRCSSPAKES